MTKMNSNSTTTKITIKHKWSIKNFGDVFFNHTHAPSIIQSDCFQPSQVKEKFKFFMRLYHRGIDREACLEDDNENGEQNDDTNVTKSSSMSLYLHLQDGADIDVEGTFSIINYNDKICNTKAINGRLSTFSQLGIDEYVSNDSKIFEINRYLKPGTMLTLFCEIEISVDSLAIFNGLSAPNISEHREIIPATESNSDASFTVIRRNYQWKIPQYDLIYKQNICSASHNFSLKNKEDINFFLRLWPNGKGCKENEENFQTESEKFLALFLYLSDCVTHNCVKALSRLSIRDMKKSRSHHFRWIYGKLLGSNGLGCERFLEIDRAADLMRENELNIHCEIELFCEENSNQDDVEEMNEICLDDDKSIIIINSSFSNSLVNLLSSNRSRNFTAIEKRMNT